MLSNGLWRERYGADPNVAGRSISINGHAFTIVGVARAEFAGIFGGIAESAWLPLSSLRDLSADSPPDPLLHYGLQVVVRLRPGVQDSVAAAEVHTLAHNFASQQHDSKYNGWDLNLGDSAHFQRGLFGIVGEQLPVLFGASVLLMVLVCINIASLLGQHAARRRREVAIRTTLGASPSNIAAQVLTETGLLAAMGALAGWGASTGISKALYVLLPNFGFPVAFNLHSDVRIMVFVIGIASVVTLTCGMYPVRQSLQVAQSEALHEGVRPLPADRATGLDNGSFSAFNSVSALSCSFAADSSRAQRSEIVTLDTGFDRANCLAASFDLSRSGYKAERGLALQAALLDRAPQRPRRHWCHSHFAPAHG